MFLRLRAFLAVLVLTFGLGGLGAPWPKGPPRPVRRRPVVVQRPIVAPVLPALPTPPAFVRVGTGTWDVRIVDDQDAPIANAAVRITTEAFEQEPPWDVTTTDQGHAHFTTLREGPYRVEVHAHGYETAFRRYVQLPANAAEISLMRAGTLVVRVARDQVTEPLDVMLAGSGAWPPVTRALAADATELRFEDLAAGVYEVRAHGATAISDAHEGIELAPGETETVELHATVGKTLRVKVVDADTNNAIEHALIRIAEDALTFTPLMLQSDADGVTSVAALRPVEHALLVGAEGYATAGPITFTPSDAEMEVALRKEATLSGIVLDARNNPVPGALLALTGRSETRENIELLAPPSLTRKSPSEGAVGELGVMAGPIPRVPTAPGLAAALDPDEAQEGAFATDEEGRFSLRGLPAGRFTLVVRHPSHPPAQTGVLVLRSGAATSDVEVRLADGGSIAGRVLDPRGFPVPFVRVELSSELEPTPRGAASREDGTFEFAAVAGHVTLSAYASGQAPARVEVDARADETVTINLTLEQAVETLRGRVLDADGYPVPRVHLRLRSLRARTPFAMTADALEDGTFTFEGLPSPPYALEAEHPDFAPPMLPAITNVRDELRVTLSRAFAVTATLVDQISGAPISNASVQLVTDALVRNARSAEDGTVQIARVANGAYELFVDAPHFVAFRKTGTLTRPLRDDAVDLGSLRLSPSATVSGYVVDRWGEAVRGVDVKITPTLSARTDARGLFLAEGVPPGTYTLLATHPTIGQASSRPTRVDQGMDVADIELRFADGQDPTQIVEIAEPPTALGVTLEAAEQGVVVRTIDHAGAGALAGLRRDDVIATIDGSAPRNAEEAARRLRAPVGQEALIEILRGERRLRFFVMRSRR